MKRFCPLSCCPLVFPRIYIIESKKNTKETLERHQGRSGIFFKRGGPCLGPRLRDEPKGTNANLRFSAGSCGFLRFPAKISGFLRKSAFPKCFVF